MTLAPMPAKRHAGRAATATPKRMTEAAFVRWALSEARVRGPEVRFANVPSRRLPDPLCPNQPSRFGQAHSL
jgi:hypothetical protein